MEIRKLQTALAVRSVENLAVLLPYCALKEIAKFRVDFVIVVRPFRRIRRPGFDVGRRLRPRSFQNRRLNPPGRPLPDLAASATFYNPLDGVLTLPGGWI